MRHLDNHAGGDEPLKRSSQEARCGSESSGFRGDPLVMAPLMEMLRDCGWGPLPFRASEALMMCFGHWSR